MSLAKLLARRERDIRRVGGVQARACAEVIVNSAPGVPLGAYAPTEDSDEKSVSWARQGMADYAMGSGVQATGGRTPVMKPGHTTKGQALPKGREKFPVQTGLWESSVEETYREGLVLGKIAEGRTPIPRSPLGKLLASAPESVEAGERALCRLSAYDARVRSRVLKVRDDEGCETDFSIKAQKIDNLNWIFQAAIERAEKARSDAALAARGMSPMVWMSSQSGGGK